MEVHTKGKEDLFSEIMAENSPTLKKTGIRTHEVFRTQMDMDRKEPSHGIL